MAVKYASHVSTRETPQSEPIHGKPMVANSAGGYSFAVDCWKRLDRFLILGNEGGSYYATERKMTQDSAKAVLECAEKDARRTAARIAEISKAGRAPKNDPAIFALALMAGSGYPEALAYVNDVCRIGTHIFQFTEAVQQFRGWGRSLKRAVGKWYTDKKPRDLAYQCVKYQQRNGWSHRDLLRLSKPKANGPTNTVLRWAVGKQPEAELLGTNDLAVIVAFEHAKVATDKAEICRLIREHDLPRECIPTQFLTEPSVWEALLANMPMTALVRNLATMTRVGLLAPMSQAVRKVCDVLADAEKIGKARLHPIALLTALKTYEAGRGERGQNTWTPVPQIVDALDAAFYLAFTAVEPTNKRWFLGIDVSGSMDSGVVAGVVGLTPRIAAGAMAMVSVMTEPNYCAAGFTSGVGGGYGGRWGGVQSGLTPITLSKRMRLDTVCQTMRSMRMGGTDCSLPMVYALENKIPVDTFVVYTDNETWAGSIHPSQALRKYREKMGIPARLAVVSMLANEFTIADPKDAGMMDFVGFDTSVPALLSDFARG